MTHRPKLPFTPRYRDRLHNPQSRTCLAHLSRSCGTCAHWSGPLRGRGQCPIYAGPVTGSEDARRCPDWTRKWAAGRLPEGEAAEA